MSLRSEKHCLLGQQINFQLLPDIKKKSHDMTFTCDLKCSMSPIKAINVLLYLQYTSQEKLPVIINAISLTIFPDFVQISHMSLQIIETQMPVTI